MKRKHLQMKISISKLKQINGFIWKEQKNERIILLQILIHFLGANQQARL
jgi:hypothetical protein